MKSYKIIGILLALFALMPEAIHSETLCFHSLGYVINGVKEASSNKENYVYYTIDGTRAYRSDANGYKTEGNVMYFRERNGSIVDYCAKDPIGNFAPMLGQLRYDTSTGRLNTGSMGIIFIYERVSAKPKTKPQMY